MLILLLSAALLLASYNGLRQKRRIDRLENDLVQVQADTVVFETAIATLSASIATNHSIVALLAKKPSLSLDENGFVRGVELPGPDGPILTAFRTSGE
jgi:hypothetical protein